MNTKRAWYVIMLCAILFVFSALPAVVSADELYMKNGDYIKGSIIGEYEDAVTMQVGEIGIIEINREFIEKVVREGKEVIVIPAQDLWKGNLSIGYNQAGGNTKKTEFFGSVFSIRKTDDNEFTIKGNAWYSASNKLMDSQKWYGTSRYAYSFWDRKWYNFFKLEADHDRFANIDYRAAPSLGLGYWLSDKPDWKAMTELAYGYELTYYRDTTDDRTASILIPRVFVEKKIDEHLTVSHNMLMYPSLDHIKDYRVHSETGLIIALNDSVDLTISFIDDFISRPTPGIAKNDYRIISSAGYSFSW